MILFNPCNLAQLLCDQWEYVPILKAHHRHRPTPDQLTKILESAYLASMETEEGRTLKFGLILRSSMEADEPGYGIVHFGDRLPVSSSEIRRLAPATGPSTFIAVELTDNEPFIWGGGGCWLGVDPFSKCGTDIGEYVAP